MSMNLKFAFGEKRTGGTADTCEYAFCHAPGAGEARYHALTERNGIPWTMCAEHVKPEHHPPVDRKWLVKW